MKKDTTAPNEQKQTNGKDNRYDLLELPESTFLSTFGVLSKFIKQKCEAG